MHIYKIGKYSVGNNQTIVRTSQRKMWDCIVELKTRCVCETLMPPKRPFLAPLAIGQRAIVMELCSSSVCPSVRALVHPSVNSPFKNLLLRNY